MHFSVLSGLVAPLDLLSLHPAGAEIAGKEEIERFGQNLLQTSVKSSPYLQRHSPTALGKAPCLFVSQE